MCARDGVEWSSSMLMAGRNLEFQYHMNDGWVKSVDDEKDRGVLMSKDLKFSKQS